MATTASPTIWRRSGAEGVRRIDGVLAVLALLAIAGASAVVFLAAVYLIDPEQMPIGRDALAAAADAEGWVRVAVVVGSLAAGLAAAGALGARLFAVGGSVPGTPHVVAADDQGVVLVDTASVQSVAEAASLRARGVVAAEAAVAGRGVEPVRLRIDAFVYAGTDFQGAGKEVQRQARSSVQQLVGLEVRDVQVTVRALSNEAFERGLA